jgi:signal recognition particle subunit SRP54
VDEPLLDELRQVHSFLEPRETLLVCDAATGQQAVQVAEKFHAALGLTGIILTKLDGDARGGAALSLRTVTGRPIKFIGTGEKVEQFEAFHPDRLAGRILGMGDVVSLVEKAAEAISEDDARRMEQKLRSASFDLDDFLQQFKALRKMGPLENILGMVPGMDKLKGSSVDEKQLKRVEAIILSMTPLERARPDILNARRRQRIARGSGTHVSEVNNLILRFTQMRKMMKNMGSMKKLMAKAGGGLKF